MRFDAAPALDGSGSKQLAEPEELTTDELRAEIDSISTRLHRLKGPQTLAALTEQLALDESRLSGI